MKFEKAFLLDKNAYNHEVETIELRETHISFVFLTGKFVYKVKKEVKFGDILDFSTLERRKEFCQKEIELNSRFSPEVYIKRVGISKAGKIVEDNNPDIIEYAVQMHQLPENRLLSTLLAENKVTENMISNLASMLSDFHKTTEKKPDFGSTKEGDAIWEKWDENFRTTETFRKESKETKDKIFAFIKSGILGKRVTENKIGDNHGDLQANNIFVIQENSIKIVDCIDFNPLLRYGDHAEDVGFLAMELDFLNQNQLSELLVQEYIKNAQDKSLKDVLSFYKCYRAYVRGKVYGFQASNEGDEKIKSKLEILSDQYYNLAYTYLENL